MTVHLSHDFLEEFAFIKAHKATDDELRRGRCSCINGSPLSNNRLDRQSNNQNSQSNNQNMPMNNQVDRSNDDSNENPRPRKRKRRVSDEYGNNSYICLHCIHANSEHARLWSMGSQSDRGVAPITHHFLQAHPEESIRLHHLLHRNLADQPVQRQSNTNSQSQMHIFNSESLDKEEYTKLIDRIVTFFFAANIALRNIEHPAFHELLSYLKPGLNLNMLTQRYYKTRPSL